MELGDASAVVFGGASGLGEAAVRALADAGVDCVVGDVDEARGTALADELPSRVTFCRADVSNPDDVDAVFAAPRQHPVRIVVNCAFLPGGQRLVNRAGLPHDPVLFKRLLDVNLVGTFNTMAYGAAAIARATPLADSERGVIITTSSIVAFEGQEGQCAYAAAKGAIAAMTLPAARDLRSHGIRVVTIAPGTFLTPPVERLAESARNDLASEALTPARLGDPAEFGRLIVHICENSFLNGTTIRLDAGARLSPRTH